MKYWVPFLFVFFLVGCSTTRASEPEQKTEASGPVTAPSNLPKLGEAPELANELWLNTPGPLRLADLRGQVVLLEMWTFG